MSSRSNKIAQQQLTLDEARAECELALSRLESLFKPHCRLTLLMRNPQSDNGDLILTRDDLGEVEQAIHRLNKP